MFSFKTVCTLYENSVCYRKMLIDNVGAGGDICMFALHVFLVQVQFGPHLLYGFDVFYFTLDIFKACVYVYI